jgi:predicted TIM-barrel fold metal-dependent hydrolase
MSDGHGSAPGWLAPCLDGRPPMQLVGDVEGERLPSALPPVVDAHVHLFPPPVLAALWRWFEAHAWPVRYKLEAPATAQFLFERGVSRVVGLAYAHKPGMSRSLNRFMASLSEADPRIVGAATVLPGEPDAVEILEEAFSLGLAGVKLHCHVQCFSPDAEVMEALYATCERHDKPLVMHAGREPKTPAYKCDPHLLCDAERVAHILRDHPRLRLCVPHLGADEFDAYEQLLGRFDNLWLDTTMAVAGYFPGPLPERLMRARPDRILYGTDFPNLPYAWDRELGALLRLGLGEEALAALLGGNAARLFGLTAV